MSVLSISVRRLAAVVTAAMVLVGANSLGTSSAAEASPFLTREGSKLIYRGAPFQYAGVNAFGLAGCQWDYSDTEIETLFTSLPTHSVTQMWAFPNFDLGRIDRVVKLASKHNQMLILSLDDGNPSCGRPGAGDAFWNGGYKTEYVNWVNTIVPKYKDNPTIAMWEIMNEPRGGNMEAAKKFFDVAAAQIKSLDSNHLVESGAAAGYASATKDYTYVHSGKDIDVVSVHEYDWDDNNARAIVSNWYRVAKAAGDALNKPVIVGESGVKGGDGCDTSRAARATAYKAKYDQYLADGAAGVNIWNWAPRPGGGCTWENVSPGEPTMVMLQNYKVPGTSVPTSNPSAPATPTTVITTTSTTVPATPAVVEPTYARTLVDDFRTTGKNSFSYTGTWVATKGALMGAQHSATQDNSSAVLTFTGTSAWLYGATGPDGGKAAVYLDGVLINTVSMKSASDSTGKRIVQTPTVAAGVHELKIVTTGSVSIDGAQIRS